MMTKCGSCGIKTMNRMLRNLSTQERAIRNETCIKTTGPRTQKNIGGKASCSSKTLSSQTVSSKETTRIIIKIYRTNPAVG